MGTKAQEKEITMGVFWKAHPAPQQSTDTGPKTSGLSDCFQKMNQIVYSNNQINPAGGKRIIIVLIRIGSVVDPFIQELPSSDWACCFK